jgi:hypothetical protein
VISFTRSKNPIIFNYKICNNELNRVFVIKDLGVHFEHDLSFKYNHQLILNKSYKMLGFINRNTQQFKNVYCLKNLFCSLVRPTLEFGSLIWSQNLSTYINDLEVVQYKFLKRVTFINNIPISRESVGTVQCSISLDSLSLRRKLADVLFIYDLLNGNIDCPYLLEKLGIRVPSYFSRSKELFIIPYFLKKSGANSFFPRALNIANKMSFSLEFFSTTRDNFKYNALLFLRNSGV